MHGTIFGERSHTMCRLSMLWRPVKFKTSLAALSLMAIIPVHQTTNPELEDNMWWFREVQPRTVYACHYTPLVEAVEFACHGARPIFLDKRLHPPWKPEEISWGDQSFRLDPMGPEGSLLPLLDKDDPALSEPEPNSLSGNSTGSEENRWLQVWAEGITGLIISDSGISNRVSDPGSGLGNLGGVGQVEGRPVDEGIGVDSDRDSDSKSTGRYGKLWDEDSNFNYMIIGLDRMFGGSARFDYW